MSDRRQLVGTNKITLRTALGENSAEREKGRIHGNLGRVRVGRGSEVKELSSTQALRQERRHRKRTKSTKVTDRRTDLKVTYMVA